MELRVKSDIFCVQTSTELHQAQDQLDQLRTERQRLSERLAEAEAALESHQVVSDSLERRAVCPQYPSPEFAVDPLPSGGTSSPRNLRRADA
ncbi:hypothetical protein PF002_g30340 [Phytophthora fragariae]|uniref:Uncharacterized protein n=2 Tax=Phytophthora TaxID=4783 RepID=A0A6A3HA46_9STRA|nr:hypothetical protein PF003_g31582 [Phytophthora fragariae]KAE9323975.1 hypothetical protein PR003_g16837 [Phytophthora rubi]KAE8966060.1 hypothetical protein PF011_g28071 [Phytophthora fragariae]KAE9062833.1 hypothetical protein PF007_g29766 [Phytophthora fragariae]KAE9068621.1 hypothetical protein PF006_g29752 [Phytophthora fragariae]